MALDTISILLLFLGAFLLTYFLEPRIIGVALYKKLTEKPNERSSHDRLTPNIGGVAFYICLMLSFYFLDEVDRYNSIPSFIPGLTILFIIGLKDDLTILTARAKLFSQFVSCLFLLLHFKFEIFTFNGFMGINSLNPYFAGILALFIMLTIINSYNLIDGIDGLATIIGLIILLLYGILFYQSKLHMLMGLCVVLIGSLSAFLRYNFSKKRKIFMGDTGTMVVGFIIASMTIRLLSLPIESLENIKIIPANLTIAVASILILPLYDLTRVVFIRLLKGKKPFIADRSHIHHLLIDQLQLSHKKASLLLGFVNLIFSSTMIVLSFFTTPYLLLFIFLMLILFFSILLHLLKRKKGIIHTSDGSIG